MRKCKLTVIAAVLVLGLSGSAFASVIVDVYALNNASENAPLNTGVMLTVGEAFSISADPTDTWSAGINDRTSNANGLGPGNPYGGNYGLWTEFGSSFYYGSLVGRIDSGSYFLVGTSFSGTAANAGELKLMYWDGYYGDNTGYVTATINTGSASVPEPASMLLLGAGLIGIGLMRKKR